MIKLTDVCKEYSSGTVALNDINITIEDGEFVFIVGKSGSGKSTMIKLLLREITPTTGTVMVNDYNLNRLSQWRIHKFRRTLGVVFQDFRLIPTLSVYDNVAFGLRVTNCSKRFIRNRVPYILNLLELAGKAKRKPHELSGGEQQRVALARALANDPQLIIADEPTGNVDPTLSHEIVELLKMINGLGTTVVMVTHEHELVKRFGGRTINIDEGRVVFDDVIKGEVEQ